jgi:hypothetical protein
LRLRNRLIDDNCDRTGLDHGRDVEDRAVAGAIDRDKEIARLD